MDPFSLLLSLGASLAAAVVVDRLGERTASQGFQRQRQLEKAWQQHASEESLDPVELDQGLESGSPPPGWLEVNGQLFSPTQQFFLHPGDRHVFLRPTFPLEDLARNDTWRKVERIQPREVPVRQVSGHDHQGNYHTVELDRPIRVRIGNRGLSYEVHRDDPEVVLELEVQARAIDVPPEISHLVFPLTSEYSRRPTDQDPIYITGVHMHYAYDPKVLEDLESEIRQRLSIPHGIEVELTYPQVEEPHIRVDIRARHDANPQEIPHVVHWVHEVLEDNGLEATHHAEEFGPFQQGGVDYQGSQMTIWRLEDVAEY